MIDELPLEAIEALVVRREVRWGEAVAGLAIALFAILFRSWLLVTGMLLAALGGLGILHALLLPTRWIEILSPSRPVAAPWRILATRRKSARVLRETLARALLKRTPQEPR